jgi:hypothetical protein
VSDEAERPPLPRWARPAAIGLVGLAFVVLVGGWLLRTHTHYAGTNSVAPRYSLPPLTPGHRLCLTNLELPGDANGMRLLLAGPGGRTVPVTMRLFAGGRTQVSTALLPAAGFGGEFRFAPLGRDSTASACLTTRDRLGAESGMPAAQPQAGAAYLDRKYIGQLSIWYLRLPPPRLVSQLPAAASRASLFRPGFVGGWTYAVLAALVLLCCAAGLRLVARGSR